jgi:hypothetical protein
MYSEYKDYRIAVEERLREGMVKERGLSLLKRYGED